MSNTAAPPGPPHRPSLASELDAKIGDVEPEQGAATAFLVGLSGHHAGKLFRIRPGESILGRSSAALVRLDEKAASHHHAKVFTSGRAVYVEDLESTNGTFVNNQRIRLPTELHAGDVLRCGTSNFGFLTDVEDDAQHTRAMARLTAGPMTLAPGGSRAMLAVHPGGSSTPSHALVRNSAPPIIVHEAAPADPLQTLNTLIDRTAFALQFAARYRWLLVTATLIGAGLGGATILLFVPKAVARCEIVLRGVTPTGRRQGPDRLVDYFELADKNFVNPDLVRQTMKQTGIPANSLAGTASSLEFVPVGQSVFAASYSSEDARFAEQFLAAHVRNFLEREIGKAISLVKSEVDLLLKEYRDNEEQLRAVESKMRDFKQQHLNELPENAAGQLGSRATLSVQRDALAAQLDRASQELILARKQLGSGDAVLTSSVVRAQPYQVALTQVRQQIAAAKAQGFADSHPELVKFRSQEAELLKLEQETVNHEASAMDLRADVATQQLRQKVAALEVVVNSTARELSTTEGRIGSAERIAGAMPAVEAGYADLLRKLAEKQTLDQRLHEQLKAKELQLEFERASVAARYEVMKQPHSLGVSRSSAAVKRAGAGAALGLVLAVILAAFHWLGVYVRKRQIQLSSAAPGRIIRR